MERKLTCIVCPLGCELCAEVMDGKVQAVTGNTCPRGKKYAESEFTNPERTVTSTIRCIDGSVVAVKTDHAIPKGKITECIRIINNTVARLPICIGDVIIKDVFGANIVATANKSRKKNEW